MASTENIMGTPNWEYLSPIDQLMPRTPVGQIFCFPSTDPQVYETLKDGLRQVAKTLPWVAASVVKEKSRKGESKLGAPFVDIDTLLTYRERLDLSYSTLKDASFPIAPLNAPYLSPKIHEGFIPEPGPIFRARLTRINGGFTLSVIVHHSVFDGTAYAAVIELWADSCRVGPEKPIPVHPVRLDRTAVLRSPNPEAVKPSDIHHLKASKNSFLEKTAIYLKSLPRSWFCLRRNRRKQPIRTVFFRFSGATLQNLKKQANAYAAEVGVEFLSTNDILSALIWSAMTPINEISKDKPFSTLGMSVNIRGRLEPPLPSDYMGNAITQAWTHVSPEKLYAVAEDGSIQALAEISGAIRQSLNSVNNKDLTSLINYVHHHDPSKLLWAPGPIDFYTVSWANQDPYGLDWGGIIGRCELALGLKFRINNICMVFPRDAKTGGGLDVMISQCPAKIEQLKRSKIMNRYSQLVDSC